MRRPSRGFVINEDVGGTLLGSWLLPLWWQYKGGPQCRLEWVEKSTWYRNLSHLRLILKFIEIGSSQVVSKGNVFREGTSHFVKAVMVRMVRTELELKANSNRVL